jgi:glyoxylase-like metal-dependent hydrolase (beta-lactamase superfamily II)
VEGCLRVLLDSDFQINEHCHQIDTTQWALPKIGVVYVVKSEKTFLVDAGTSQTNEKILSTLQEFQISPESIDAIVVTHGHYDHGAGVAGLLKKMPNALVFASEKTAEILRKPTELLETTKRHYGDAAVLVSDYPPVSDVQVTEEGKRFNLGSGISLEVFTLPGHTPGSIGLLEPTTKTFFAGDAVCNYNEEFEFYMPPSFPELFDYENYLKSLDKMLGIDFEYLCMGHFGTQKQPKAKQIIRRAADTAKDWKDIIVDVYGKTKSEDQVYNALMERIGDNEYVKGFPDFIRRSILGQLIRGYVLDLKL